MKNEKIEVQTFRYLGVHLDSKMNFHAHILKNIKQASPILRNVHSNAQEMDIGTIGPKFEKLRSTSFTTRYLQTKTSIKPLEARFKENQTSFS